MAQWSRHNFVSHIMNDAFHVWRHKHVGFDFELHALGKVLKHNVYLFWPMPHYYNLFLVVWNVYDFFFFFFLVWSMNHKHVSICMRIKWHKNPRRLKDKFILDLSHLHLLIISAAWLAIRSKICETAVPAKGALIRNWEQRATPSKAVGSEDAEIPRCNQNKTKSHKGTHCAMLSHSVVSSSLW